MAKKKSGSDQNAKKQADVTKKLLEDQKKAQDELRAKENLRVKSVNELNKSAKELTGIYKDLATLINSVANESKTFGDNFSDVADISKKLLSNLEDIGAEYYNQIDLSKQLERIQEERQDLLKKEDKFKTKFERASKKEKDAQEQLKKIQEDYNDLLNSGNEELADKAKLQIEDQKKIIENIQLQKEVYAAKKLEVKLEQDRLNTQDAVLGGLKAQSDLLDSANEKAKEMGISIQKMSGEIVAPFQKAQSFLEGMPGGTLISKAFGIDSLMEKVQKDVMGSFANSLAATGSVGKASFAALRTGAMSFMTSLAPILPILLAVAAALYAVKKAFEMDQEVTDMARGLGISKEEAAGVHEELLDIAESTEVIGASSEALGAAYTDLAKSMGVTKLANKEMAETQVLLTKQMGMATEDAAAFQKMSMAGGKSAEQNMVVIKAGVDAMTGGLMNYKEVASEIAKSSKAVQASYKGNIAALTKAVVTAKKFGMTLDDTKKAADSILDIETSLENEMKANVLTGKNMNLNEARNLALKGKSAEAVEEMMKQAGGYNELLQMESYQRDAIAQAMGMSTDEMMKAAETQKNMESIAKDVGVALGENGKFTEEQLKAAEAMGNEEATKLLLADQQASAQEKLAALGDKLMVIFSKLATPIMEMLDPLMEAVDFLFPAIKAALDYAFAPVKAIFGIIGGIVKIFKGDFLGGIHDIGAAIIGVVLRPFTFIYDLLVGFFPSIGKLVDKAMGWITDKLKNLLPNWALKLLGIGGKDASKEASPASSETSVDDAMIGPDGGLVVSGAKGTYKLNQDDSVIAGTGLGESTGGAAPVAAPGGGSSEMISLLKELIAKVDQPVKITIGNKAIDEIESQIAIKRSFTTKADRSYGGRA